MTKPQKERTRRHRQALGSLRAEIARKERQLESARRDIAHAIAEYSRFDRALDRMMRDIATELADGSVHATSSASERLIASLYRASRTINGRDERTPEAGGR